MMPNVGVIILQQRVRPILVKAEYGCQGSSEISCFPICSIIMPNSHRTRKTTDFSWTDTVDEGEGGDEFRVNSSEQ